MHYLNPEIYHRCIVEYFRSTDAFLTSWCWYPRHPPICNLRLWPPQEQQALVNPLVLTWWIFFATDGEIKTVKNNWICCQACRMWSVDKWEVGQRRFLCSMFVFRSSPVLLGESDAWVSQPPNSRDNSVVSFPYRHNTLTTINVIF